MLPAARAALMAVFSIGCKLVRVSSCRRRTGGVSAATSFLRIMRLRGVGGASLAGFESGVGLSVIIVAALFAAYAPILLMP